MILTLSIECADKDPVDLSNENGYREALAYNMVNHVMRFKPKNIVLGSGRMAMKVVDAFANYFAKNKEQNIFHNVKFYSTSEKTTSYALRKGLTTESQVDEDTIIDVTVDGADEVDENLCVLKGRGAAMFREKFYASISKKVFLLIEKKKFVPSLGVGEIPIEISPFNYEVTIEKIVKLFFIKMYACKYRLMAYSSESYERYVTDNGNFILLVNLDRPLTKKREEIIELDKQLHMITGVFETGFFTDESYNICYVDEPENNKLENNIIRIKSCI